MPQRGVGRVGQVEVGALPVPHLPPGVPGIGQDRRHGAQRPCRAGSARLPSGSAADGHGIPESLSARVILATLCPASRRTNIQRHRRCGRIRLQAVRPPSPRRVRLVRMRTGIREAYPYGGRPPRYRPCSRVCAAIAVRTQIQVSSVAVYPVMYRYIRTGYLRCQMPCPPEPGSFADQDDRLAFRPAGPGEKARDICEPDCRDRRRRIAPRHDPVRQAREEFGCHA